MRDQGRLKSHCFAHWHVGQGGFLCLQGVSATQKALGHPASPSACAVYIMSCIPQPHIKPTPHPTSVGFLPLGAQTFALGTKLLCGKLMSTNSTSCHSLCSWQLHALKAPLLVGASLERILFFFLIVLTSPLLNIDAVHSCEAHCWILGHEVLQSAAVKG